MTRGVTEPRRPECGERGYEFAGCPILDRVITEAILETSASQENVMRRMPDEDAEPCGCHWLEREADEPLSPVEFDPVFNEYHFKRHDGGTMMIYHCPFCGGAAPKSKRAQMFAVITEQEQERLTELTGALRTLDEVMNALGKPDLDAPASSMVLESDGNPPRVDLHRQLRYEHLSDTASVVVREIESGRVSITFQGKCIGPPPNSRE